MKSKIEIKHYKVLSLPLSAEPNSIYYVLDAVSKRVKTFITDLNGVPIPLIDLKGLGIVQSVTGTGVTGTPTDPKIDIPTFVSTQLGNLVKLSASDGKLVVTPITSPDRSIEITETALELQLKLSADILDRINNVLESTVNKQNSLTHDGTGVRYPTVDARNTVVLTITESIEVHKDKHHVHNQVAAASTWVILHNLGKHPSVTTIDSGNNTVIGDCEYNSNNQLTLTFSAAFSGKAYLN